MSGKGGDVVCSGDLRCVECKRSKVACVRRDDVATESRRWEQRLGKCRRCERQNLDCTVSQSAEGRKQPTACDACRAARRRCEPAGNGGLATHDAVQDLPRCKRCEEKNLVCTRQVAPSSAANDDESDDLAVLLNDDGHARRRFFVKTAAGDVEIDLDSLGENTAETEAADAALADAMRRSNAGRYRTGGGGAGEDDEDEAGYMEGFFSVSDADLERLMKMPVIS